MSQVIGGSGPVQIKHLLALSLMLIVLSACSLSASPDPQDAPTATSTLFRPATLTPGAPTATSTVRPTNTLPAPTSTRIVGPTSVPLYNVRQPLPGPICAAFPTSGAVNIRSGPGTVYPVIGLLPEGNWVLARWVDASSAWYQISYPGSPVEGGWLSSTVTQLQGPCTCSTSIGCSPYSQPPTNLPPTAGPTATYTPPPGQCMVAVNIQGDVSIYNQPTFDAGEYGLLRYGTFIPVVGLTQDGWYAVSVNTGIVPSPGIYAYRWVRADPMVAIHGPCSNLEILDYRYPANPAECRLVANSGQSVPMYNQPSELSGVWGTLTDVDSIHLVGQSFDGWYAVEPNVAQAANVGIWRLRWIKGDAPVAAQNCGIIPTVSYTGETVGGL